MLNQEIKRNKKTQNIELTYPISIFEVKNSEYAVTESPPTFQEKRKLIIMVSILEC